MKAVDFLNQIGMVMKSAEYKGKVKEGKRQLFAWLVTLAFEGRTLEVPFKCGMAYQGFQRNGKWERATPVEISNYKNGFGKTPLPIPPDIDVLAYCLLSDCQSIDCTPLWEDWAEQLGYNVDSISDHKVYQACVEQYQKIRKFLNKSFRSFLNCEPE